MCTGWMYNIIPFCQIVTTTFFYKRIVRSFKQFNVKLLIIVVTSHSFFSYFTFAWI